MQPLLPAQLGPFRIGDELGRGALGVVVRAFDERLQREVAIKVLRDGGHAREAWERLQHEARCLARVTTPGVAALYGLESNGEHVFLVLELVPGQTLGSRLRGGALPAPLARSVLRDVAQALRACHRGGVLHCDLKPENVMLRPDGKACLLDLGLSRMLCGERAGAAGTPAYMSPEQSRGEPVDEAVDAWSFGCLLFEVWSGVSPFARGNVAATLEAVRAAEPDWSLLPASMPAEVSTLAHDLLERTPARRRAGLARAERVLRDPAGAAPAVVTGGTSGPVEHLQPTAPLVGRQAELRRCLALAADPDVAEVWITGAPGMGKTCLALHVAARLASRGTRTVELVDADWSSGAGTLRIVTAPAAPDSSPAVPLAPLAPEHAATLLGAEEPRLLEALAGRPAALRLARALLVSESVEELARLASNHWLDLVDRAIARLEPRAASLLEDLAVRDSGLAATEFARGDIRTLSSFEALRFASLVNTCEQGGRLLFRVPEWVRGRIR